MNIRRKIMRLLGFSLSMLSQTLGLTLLATILVNYTVEAKVESSKIMAQGHTDLAELPPFSSRHEPVDDIDPSDGMVDIRVYNRTGDDISYRVVGNTDFRTLSPDSSEELAGLPLSVNFFFARSGEGLATATVEVNETENIVEVFIEEAVTLRNERDSILIDEMGSIYIL